MRGAIAIVIGFMPLVAGCGQLFGTVVDMPRDAAASMLYNMAGNADLMDMQIGLSGTTIAISHSSDGIVWTYSRFGKPACAFTAHVSEETAETSLVWSDVDDISAKGEDVEYMCAAINVIGKESVAATLENRAADAIKAQTEVAALTPAHLASVFKEVSEEVKRQSNSQTEDCSNLGTSAAQAACHGNSSLIDRSDRRDSEN